jgi:hypothetical protein
MIRRSLALTLAAFFFAALPAAATAAPRTASATGIAKVRGTDVLVEVFVAVPQGQSARQAADAALAEQGARPGPPPGAGGSGGPGFTGLVWDVLPVVQNYNGAGERVAGARTALTNTYGDWSSVSGSTYRITSGGTTTRCPSLVRECAGAQRNDRFNDVGWARLANGTLGVTWSTSNTDEADMAINTRYAWSTGCVARPSAYDLESVYLHENGHVAGLGHSTNVSAVMYPSYQTARCALAQDDKNGIAALY